MPGNHFLLRKVNDIPLNYKFGLIYVLCILIPIIAINLFFFYQNSHQIRIREEDNYKKSLERASSELNGMIEESVALSHSILSDSSLYEALDRTYASQVEFYDVFDEYLRNKLKRYMSVYSNIIEISVYTDNPSIQNGSNYHILNSQVRESEWYKRITGQSGSFAVVAFEEDESYQASKRISVISRMNSYPAWSNYAKFLRIDLNLSRVYGILDRESGSIHLQLLDDNNRIVANSSQSVRLLPYEPEGEAAGTMEAKLSDAQFLSGWKLVGKPDDKRIHALLKAAGRSILWLSVISTFIPTILIYIILRSYHYRIKKLARHMSKVRNERFDLIAIQEGKDEIGGLIRHFNVMTEKINALINDVYKLEIEQKDIDLERVRTEMNMLQSQMNPHFLFNTLNALLVVCTKNGYKDVAEIIKNLSRLLRRLLASADDLVPLEEELHFTEMYLQIEKFRFGDRFAYEFDVNPEAAGYKVPKMSVQTLVENACKHGLQAIKGTKRIEIKARITHSCLEIDVSDNGIGIEAAKLDELLLAVRMNRGMDGHVGLRNLYRRLELYYRSGARLLLQSESGSGTKARIQIPLNRLEEHMSSDREDKIRVQRAAGR